MSEKDSGRAFPQPMAFNKGDPYHASEYGLGGVTLRDYFAAKAMPVYLQYLGYISLAQNSHDVERICEQAALHSYMMADAMLARRKQ